MNTTLVIIIVAVIVIFFICREIMCWFWKINERVEGQTEILRQIESLSNNISANFEELSDKLELLGEINGSLKQISESLTNEIQYEDPEN